MTVVFVRLLTGGLPWLGVRDHDPVLRQRGWSGPAVHLLCRARREQVSVHVTARRTSVRRRTALPNVPSVYCCTSQLAYNVLFLHLFVCMKVFVTLLKSHTLANSASDPLRYGLRYESLVSKVSKADIAVGKQRSPHRYGKSHLMGSHSVTCHSAAMTFPQ